MCVHAHVTISCHHMHVYLAPCEPHTYEHTHIQNKEKEPSDMPLLPGSEPGELLRVGRAVPALRPTQSRHAAITFWSPIGNFRVWGILHFWVSGPVSGASSVDVIPEAPPHAAVVSSSLNCSLCHLVSVHLCSENRRVGSEETAQPGKRWRLHPQDQRECQRGTGMHTCNLSAHETGSPERAG